MDAPSMFLLQLAVLARFDMDLAAAVAAGDAGQFEHLARRAEMPGPFGERERALVDEYRARAVFTHAFEGVGGHA
jgi:hypothetical protein